MDIDNKNNNGESIDELRMKAFIEAEQKIANMAREEIKDIIPYLEANIHNIDKLLGLGDTQFISSLSSLVLVLTLILTSEYCNYKESRASICKSSSSLVQAIKSYDPSKASFHTFQLMQSYFPPIDHEDDNAVNLHQEFTMEQVQKDCGGDLGGALYSWSDAIFTILTVRFVDSTDEEAMDSDYDD